MLRIKLESTQRSWIVFCNWKVLLKFVSELQYGIPNRPLQDVDVLAVLEFLIPCFRPVTPALYPRSLPTNHEGHGRKLGRPRRLQGREQGLQWSRTARTTTSLGARIPNLIDLSNFNQIFPTSKDLSNSNGIFQFHSKLSATFIFRLDLSNFASNFPTLSSFNFWFDIFFEFFSFETKNKFNNSKPICTGDDDDDYQQRFLKMSFWLISGSAMT